ncbi:MAG TPA: hypothetical protein DDW50_15695 [Firmicutes bacterium]|nr:hypothetical protein [Bacillota bacterium]
MNMFKVLIVEDETILRKGLIGKIDWKQYQLELAGEATDGKEALIKVAELNPDIVLTDIRMPEMDGLQFIAKAQPQQPQIRFIIISGYNDFDYARQALRLGVIDYLLKPISADELNQVLGNVRDELCLEGQKIDYQYFLETNYQSFQEMIHDRELTHLISGTATIQESENIRLLFKAEHLYPEHLQVIVIQIEHSGEMDPPQDINEMLERGKQIIGDHFTKLETSSGFVFKQMHRFRELVTLLTANMEMSPALIREWVESAAAVLKVTLGMPVTIGIGASATYQTVHQSYNQAQSAARNKILKGNGQIYDFQEIQHLHTPVSLDIEQERLLFSFLDAGNLEQIFKWLESQFDKMVTSSNSLYQDLESFCIQIVFLFRKYLRGKAPSPDLFFEVQENWSDFFGQLHSWTEALTYLQQQAESIIGLIQSGKEWHGESIVLEVKDYINQHYYENISLNWVAGRYFIHPNYFSQRFKEICGESFKDCIIRVRMAKALELIHNPAISIEQVGQLVGYEDPTYFSTVFRRTYGVPPSKFRESY